MTTHKVFGKPITRVEDGRFLRGKGKYTDDISITNQTYAIIVRSPHAHAKIEKIDTSLAKSVKGVVAVFIGVDMFNDGVKPIPPIWEITCKDGQKMAEPDRWALAKDKVCHVGEAVAVVIAETKNIAKDAAEKLEISYTPLPPVVDLLKAVKSESPLIHNSAKNNICFDWQIGDAEETEKAFRNAKHVVKLELINSRIIAHPMENRVALAEYNSDSEKFTLYTST